MSTLTLAVKIPDAFRVLAQPARYKAFYGGRGSAKSHSFAVQLILDALQKPIRVLCAREIQKSVKESVKALLDKKIHEMGAGDLFRSLDTEIRCPHGGLISFAGLKSNPDSVKSMEGLNRAWVEEASRVSRRSLDLLIPTVREEGSELWFSWNPESELDPVDVMFRSKRPPTDSVVRRVTWRDNPWFPAVLEQERLDDLANDPAKHEHVWEGGYRQAQEGAYYAALLAIAATEGRITRVPHDPALPVYAAFDLGSSVREVSTAVWFAQVVGAEIRLIDYLQTPPQHLSGDHVGIEWYAKEMHAKPYSYRTVYLPHDGGAVQLGTGKTTAEMLDAQGFDVEIVPKIGVDDGIETVKRMLPRCWIDEVHCAQGLRALREYHERWDETRRVSLGPEHDWSSHPADALRYLAVSLTTPVERQEEYYEVPPSVRHASGGAWMT